MAGEQEPLQSCSGTPINQSEPMSQQPIHQICTNSNPMEKYSLSKSLQGLSSRLPDGYLQFLAKNPKEEFRHPLWFRSGRRARISAS